MHYMYQTTRDESNLLAWDHNNDNDYRKGMTFIQRIRFFHNEYLDYIRSNDKVTLQFRIRLLSGNRVCFL